jgi:hypothetical protein
MRLHAINIYLINPKSVQFNWKIALINNKILNGNKLIKY